VTFSGNPSVGTYLEEAPESGARKLEVEVDVAPVDADIKVLLLSALTLPQSRWVRKTAADKADAFYKYIYLYMRVCKSSGLHKRPLSLKVFNTSLLSISFSSSSLD